MTLTELWQKIVDRWSLRQRTLESRQLEALRKQSEHWQNEWKECAREREQLRLRVRELDASLAFLKERNMTLVNWAAMDAIAQGVYDKAVSYAAGNRKKLREAIANHGAVSYFLIVAERIYAQTSHGEQAGSNPRSVT